MINDFDFYNPVKIYFGKYQLRKVNSLIPDGLKIMMLYGGGSIKKNGVYDKITESLIDRDIVMFGGVEPNPSYETCMKAVEIIKKENIGFLLAVGGGSVIDATKFIGAAALYQGDDPWNILTKGEPVTASLPLATVLTLPATGSEMNSNAVINRKSTREKLSFGSVHSFPQFSILLPEAAATLPQRQVANGIVDAFIHVIEQYLTYPVNAIVQDRFSESLLKTLIEVAPDVYADPSDYDAMSNLMWAATMALNGLIGKGVPGDWSVHDIGHELTALHNIDHARTLAIVLPGLWEVLKEEKMDKLVQYGERVWDITEGTNRERADRAIELTVQFFESLGVKTRLSDYEVSQDTIDTIVNRFAERSRFGFGDRRLVTAEVVRKILQNRL